jgi:uncharacterized membrane protein YhaH (DUF805 family)
MQWYLKVLKNYFGFDGRARRMEYWMFILINLLVSIAIAVVEGMLGSPGVVYGLYSLAVLIPTIAVGIRRLHDTGRSGWWLLLMIVPLVNLVLLVFFCLDSEEGDNAWGPNPKAAGA